MSTQHTSFLSRHFIILAVLSASCFLFMNSNAHANSWESDCGDDQHIGVPCPKTQPKSDLENPKAGIHRKKSETAGCDANFMNQIYANAFLEAEREVIIAHSMILKPDSVLEYTCFDQLAAKAGGDGGGSVFTDKEQEVEGEKVHLGDEALDEAIEKIVLKSLKSYVDKNFSHNFMGGTLDQNNSISDSYNSVADGCDFMFAVHRLAKCEDFDNIVGFMTFDKMFSNENLTDIDPRVYPNMCPGTLPFSQKMLQLANNDSDVNPGIKRDYVLFDEVSLHLEKTRRAKSGSCESVDPIPTGLRYKVVKFSEDVNNKTNITGEDVFDDKVCTNPGCYYDRKGNKCIAN